MDKYTKYEVTFMIVDVTLEKSMSLSDTASSGTHVATLKTATTEPPKTSVATP